MANMLKAKKPTMPIMTIDADLAEADRALRKTYLGTNNYDMGVLMAKHLKGLKPKGGTVCLQLGNVAADNINARAQGFRDTISGQEGHRSAEGRRRLDRNQGCPLFTNDQIDLANQQMADTFTANPNLDAFILVGGWAQFGPQAYAQVTDQVMAKLKAKKLVIVAGDTLPPQMDALKAGRSHAQIGQRPFEMGHRAPAVLIDLINGRRSRIRSTPGSTSARRRTSVSARRSSPRSPVVSEGARGRPFLAAPRRRERPREEQGAVDRWHCSSSPGSPSTSAPSRR